MVKKTKIPSSWIPVGRIKNSKETKKNLHQSYDKILDKILDKIHKN